MDEEEVGSSEGLVDLSMLGVDEGNLAFSNNGVLGVGIEEPAPSEGDRL